jgi:hypothetical protein
LNENLIYWVGMSKEFSSLMQKLMGKRIYPHPASQLTYMIDGGGIPNLPIIKSIRGIDTKKPHWLPVCFCSYPIPGEKRKKAG